MKILILGMARSGVAAAKVLVKRNNEVIINFKLSLWEINLKGLRVLNNRIILKNSREV